MKFCRHDYIWLPCGVREIRDHLYLVDLGICIKCKKAKSRVHGASPGDQLNAMLWGQRFEMMEVE